jgi:hypothetical protein
LLVIGLLVSVRVVASATREKDGRGRQERTPPRREAGKKSEPADFPADIDTLPVTCRGRRCLDAVDLLGHLLVVQVALQAIGLLTGMDLIAIALALGPLRRRDRWALWTELTYVLFAQGGYFASIAVLPMGRPRGAVFHALYACATAIFLAGLLLSQRSRDPGHLGSPC